MTARHALLFFFFTIAVALGGCAGQTPFVRQRVYRAIDEAEVKAALATLLEARGWTIDGGPKVVLQPRSEFEAAYRARRAKGAEFPVGEEALAALFGVLPPPEPGKPRASFDGGKAPVTAKGFYVPSTDTLHVLNEKPTSLKMELGQRSVLAHELHHALQARRIGWPVNPEDDRLLAFNALLEGDASVAQLGRVAELQRLPVSRILRRARYRIEEPKKVSPTASPTGRSAWETVPLASATLQAFPYETGLAFIVDLYRAGGFALVDEAYSHPPTTTEQVLHPEKYIANERPRALAPLKPPDGLLHFSQTTLGELRTRIVLEPCLGAKAAEDLARGWNGDRAYALQTTDELVLGWVSAWDTEEDAKAVEAGLERMRACLRDSSAADKRIGTGQSIRREGSVVAFARGGDEPTRAALIERLLPLPGDAPVAAPFTTMVIPPLRPPPEPSGGALQGSSYRNDFLGLSLAIPESSKAETFRPAGSRIDLLKVRGRSMIGQIGYSTRLSKPKDLDETFYEVETDIIELLAKEGQQTARYGAQEEIVTPLGRGYQRSWSNAKGRPVVRRVAFIPVCNGTGSIMIQTVFATVPGRAQADAWLDGFRWLDSKRAPPLCEHLDPEVAR